MRDKKCPHCLGSGKVIDHTIVGRDCRNWRLSDRVSLRALAKELKVSAPYLSDLELGRRNWSSELIGRYFEGLAKLKVCNG